MNFKSNITSIHFKKFVSSYQSLSQNPYENFALTEKPFVFVDGSGVKFLINGMDIDGLDANEQFFESLEKDERGEMLVAG